MQGPVKREYKSPKSAAILATSALIATVISELLVPVPAVSIITFIIAAVMFLRWQVRCSTNLQTLGTHKQKYSPSDGVISWFIPVANLVFPCLVMGEIWRRSHPDTRHGWEPGQPDTPKSLILVPWWLAFTASNIVSFGIRGEASDELSTGILIYSIAALIALVINDN